MANYKGPSEGGSGGKRGHSNMEHWTFTGELKESSKIKRRVDRRELVNEAEKEFENEPVCDECGSMFLSSSTEYQSICSECAHWLYGSSRCEHETLNGRCCKCGWDGSTSKYIESIKGK